MGLEFTIKKSDELRANPNHKKKTDEGIVDHEKKRDRVRVHLEKERWGENLP